MHPVQTASKLYLVLDFVNGGHLFFQLYRQGIFDEDLARLYTAELVLAIAHLHSLGIAHRDLKPVSTLPIELCGTLLDVYDWPSSTEGLLSWPSYKQCMQAMH